jgi:hypothetical protein
MMILAGGPFWIGRKAGAPRPSLAACAVADAAIRPAMMTITFFIRLRVLAREFLCIGTAVGVWRTVAIALKRDGGHSDYRSLGKPPFKIVVFRLAFSQPIRRPRAPDDDHVVVVHCGSSSPDCSRTMYSAYQSGQFLSACPIRASC